MEIYGLIGYPLTHSFSKQYFTDKFNREGIRNCIYKNFPIGSIAKLPDLILENPGLCGLNVTIPYKEMVIPFLDEMDELSGAIGAVNTIKIKNTAQKPYLIGFNTDSYGFMESLRPYLRTHHKNALILGTGGAAKAVSYSLKQLNLSVTFVSRNPREVNHLSYKDLKQQSLSDFQVIVNTTPQGMYPRTDQYPDIPYESITSEYILFDLIYNPLKTKFLEIGEHKGASIINGLKMLHLQAEKAWEIWTSKE